MKNVHQDRYRYRHGKRLPGHDPGKGYRATVLEKAEPYLGKSPWTRGGRARLAGEPRLSYERRKIYFRENRAARGSWLVRIKPPHRML